MYGFFGEYVSAAQKQKNAAKEILKLQKKGFSPQPVPPFTGKIATSFWGKSWCENLSHYADYHNRLERGRSYLRNGCVCHLDIQDGCAKALVRGSSLYKIEISLTPMDPDQWTRLCQQCSANTSTLLDLMKGKLSNEVMKNVSSRENGLFPEVNEIYYNCSCPDGASLCKHVAAVLYAIGRKLDENPQLLFEMRGVDPKDLVHAELDAIEANSQGDIAPDQLGDIFGIDLDMNSNIPDVPVFAKAADTTPETFSAAVNAGPLKPVKKERQSKTKEKEKPLIDNYNFRRPKGQNIRDMKTVSGLSLKDMAKEIGVNYATLRSWHMTDGIISMHSSSAEKLENFYKKLVRKNKRKAR